jgi:uncharacterized protein (TIGR02271 family)
MERNEAEDLVPLHRLEEFKIAEGSADVRGWEVVAADGATIGTVGEMLVDTTAMEVRYLVVKLGAGWAGAAAAGAVNVPVREARIDSAGGRVYLNTLSTSDLRLLAQPGGGPDRPGPDDDQTLLEAPSGGAPAPDDEVRMTLAEEGLDIRKRVVPAGEVEVGKRVETERVREVVLLMREDVTVERRPFPEGMTDFSPRVEGDVTYVPLVEEELVIEKRLVAREELVIRKRQVVEEQVVEESLRREVPDVRGPDGAVRTDR